MSAMFDESLNPREEAAKPEPIPAGNDNTEAETGNEGGEQPKDVEREELPVPTPEPEPPKMPIPGEDEDSDPEKGEPEDDKGKLDDKPAVPKTYTVPEGSKIQQSWLDYATPTLQKMGLTQEAFATGAEFFTNYAEFVQNWENEKLANEFNTQQTEWRKEAENNPVYGGADFDKRLEDAKTALYRDEKLMPPGLVSLIRDFGFETHPGWVQHLFELEKVFGNDTIFLGNAGRNLQETPPGIAPSTNLRFNYDPGAK